jgi:hypothetical protein
MDRKAAAEELNRIRELYQDYAVKLSKAGATDAQKSKLLEMFKKKQAELSPMDDLQKLNKGQGIRIKGGTITPGMGLVGDKMPNLLNRLGSAVNTGMNLVEGDPEKLTSMAIDAVPDAMAAVGKKIGSRGLASAAPFVGGAMEALRSENAGMSPEDENTMLAEIQAKKDYMNSPAAQAAQRFKRLKGKIGGM